jgi:TonB family protein
MCDPSDKDVPVFSDPHDIGVIVDHLRCGDHVIFLEKVTAPPGFDKVHYAVGKDGYIADSYLAAPLATPGEGVTAPIPNYKPEPGYTPEARRAGIQGKVTLAIVVDTQGEVTDVQEVSEALGGGLDKIAMDTVKTWKFTPAMRKGVPIPVRVNVEINFRLYHDTP